LINEDMTVLVDAAPQVVALAMDGEKYLIQVPCVVRSGTPAAQSVGIRLPELSALISDRFIGQDDAAFGHDFFNVPVAEAKAKVRPDTMADNLGREPMTLVWIGCWGWIHVASMPHEGKAGKVRTFPRK
jgi:hypothetical protein